MMKRDSATGAAVKGLADQAELARARRLICVCLVILGMAASTLVFTVLQIRWWIDGSASQAEIAAVTRLTLAFTSAEPGVAPDDLAERIGSALGLDDIHVAPLPQDGSGGLSVPLPGKPAAHLVWNARPLGTLAMQRFAPTRLPFILGAIAVVAFMLVQFHRLAGALDQERRHAHRLARTDSLTGLGNRLGFGEELSARLLAGSPFSLACIDLDRFKAVNDKHGHAAGDAVLKGVARRLRRLASGSDTVFRLGGDEFALLLGGERDIERLVRVMVSSLDDTYSIGGSVRVPIGASMGIACAPGDGVDADRLMACADRALYIAKAADKSICVFYADLEKALPRSVA